MQDLTWYARLLWRRWMRLPLRTRALLPALLLSSIGVSVNLAHPELDPRVNAIFLVLYLLGGGTDLASNRKTRMDKQ